MISPMCVEIAHGPLVRMCIMVPIYSHYLEVTLLGMRVIAVDQGKLKANICQESNPM